MTTTVSISQQGHPWKEIYYVVWHYMYTINWNINIKMNIFSSRKSKQKSLLWNFPVILTWRNLHSLIISSLHVMCAVSIPPACQQRWWWNTCFEEVQAGWGPRLANSQHCWWWNTCYLPTRHCTGFWWALSAAFFLGSDQLKPAHSIDIGNCAKLKVFLPTTIFLNSLIPSDYGVQGKPCVLQCNWWEEKGAQK